MRYLVRAYLQFLACSAVVGFVLILPDGAGASFPGAQGKIAFTSARDGNDEIYSMNSDGSGQLRLTTNALADGEPSISPDGQKIAFWRGSTNTCLAADNEIWVMDSDGTDQVQLTSTASADCNPDWSPDGTQIIFSSFRNGNWEVYKMNADGASPTRLTNNAAYDAQPSWSPDGTQIAFLSTRPLGSTGPLDIYVMNPDGSAQTPIVEDTQGHNWVNWSPNSSQITWTRIVSGSNTEVFKSDRDGSNEVRLTTNTVEEQWPAFSPDGSQIVFVSARDGNREIYRMNADGSSQTRLTNVSAMDWLPDWQALGAPYARPGSGSPLRVSLVLAYENCTSSNSTHVAPLDLPSCSPTQPNSDVLTTGTFGQGQGYARLTSILGDVNTPADESDIEIEANITDVRCRASNAACPGGAGSDFVGKVLIRSAMRLTDRASGYGGVTATVQDSEFEFPASCTGTASSAGSTCTASTSADTLVPGQAKEGKRMIMALLGFEVRDPGPNGTGFDAGCPLNCGDGDEQVYLNQGIFQP